MSGTPTWRMVLWIGGLGALGSLARAFLGFALGRVFTGNGWLPTLVINLLGSLGMGVAVTVLGSATDPLTRHPYSLGITAGFLGGFTTYSAFAYQSFDLAAKQSYGAFCAYVGLTVVGCLAACAAGVALGRAFAG